MDKSQRYYQKNRDKVITSVHERRVAMTERIRAYKLMMGCVDCGYKAHAAALDFDHLGDKVYTISNMRSYTWEAILKEIAKCEVVCANCHRIRTYVRRLSQ